MNTTELKDWPDMGASFNVASELVNEHRRQIVCNGYDAAHDDHHVNDELGALAAFFCMPDGARDWPAKETGYGDTFGDAMIPHGWFKPDVGMNRRADLIRAGAVIVAEILRLDREAARGR